MTPRENATSVVTTEKPSTDRDDEQTAGSGTKPGPGPAESVTAKEPVVSPDSADGDNGAEPGGSTAEASAAAQPSFWSRAGRWVRRAALPLVAALAVAAVVAAGVAGWQLKQERDLDAASDAALAAARAYAVTLTSVDSSNLDRDFNAVLDGATGEFRDMYTRSSGQLRQLLVDNKATGKGVVVNAAVASATKTKVEVLLFIDQTVTNAASADPRVDRSRVQMTMELVDGRWLASRVYLP